MEYTQPDGLISPDKNPSPDSTGNGMVYKCLYYLQLIAKNEITLADHLEFFAIYENCIAKQVRGCLNRSPTKKFELTSFDDYLGFSIAAKYLYSKAAWEILNYGNKRYYLFFKWNFNNLSPYEFTFRSWLGRQPQFVTCIQMAAGIEPHIIRKIYTFFALAFGSYEHHGAVILKYIQFRSAKKWWLQLAEKIFLKRMSKKYLTGYKSAVELHLGVMHPIAKGWSNG